MYSQVILAISLLLNVGLAIPLLNNEETRQTEILPEKGIPLELNNAAKEGSTAPAPPSKQSHDLIGQETFYPGGGVWWGHRPWGGWGGWGGYRPWYGWHGWHGWHRPQWGGHWGGHWGGPWGGPWGGGTWGKTKS